MTILKARPGRNPRRRKIKRTHPLGDRLPARYFRETGTERYTTANAIDIKEIFRIRFAEKAECRSIISLSVTYFSLQPNLLFMQIAMLYQININDYQCDS